MGGPGSGVDGVVTSSPGIEPPHHLAGFHLRSSSAGSRAFRALAGDKHREHRRGLLPLQLRIVVEVSVNSFTTPRQSATRQVGPPRPGQNVDHLGPERTVSPASPDRSCRPDGGAGSDRRRGVRSRRFDPPGSTPHRAARGHVTGQHLRRQHLQLHRHGQPSSGRRVRMRRKTSPPETPRGRPALQAEEVGQPTASASSVRGEARASATPPSLPHPAIFDGDLMPSPTTWLAKASLRSRHSRCSGPTSARGR